MAQKRILFVAEASGPFDLGSLVSLLRREYEVEKTSEEARLEEVLVDGSANLVVVWAPIYQFLTTIIRAHEAGSKTSVVFVSASLGRPPQIESIRWLRAPIRPSVLLETVREILSE